MSQNHHSTIDVNPDGKRALRQLAVELRLTPRQIQERSASVFHFLLGHGRAINSPNFQSLSAIELGQLFQIVDELYLNGQLGRACERIASRPLRFRLSTRMTTSGGMTTMHTRQDGSVEFEIAIGTTPLFHTFREDQPSFVGGRKCNNRLEALQRIMEHEMIHLAEMLVWNDSNCHARRFRSIARNWFAHTESNHQLLTPADVARANLGLRVGDRVSFTAGGKQRTGYINRITKRATILVPDPGGQLFSDGSKYIKFYVPLNQLRKSMRGR